MQTNFAAALKLVLKSEGGFSNHLLDPGKATNKGITLASYRLYLDPHGTVDDLKRLTNDQAGIIYRKHYWHPVHGDDLPAGLDYAVFDFAVNSGPDRAKKYLQRFLGVEADGLIGPATLSAVAKVGVTEAINGLCDKRLVFLKNLSTWPTFGKGWQTRVAAVRAASLAMAGAQHYQPSPKGATA